MQKRIHNGILFVVVPLASLLLFSGAYISFHYVRHGRLDGLFFQQSAAENNKLPPLRQNEAENRYKNSAALPSTVHSPALVIIIDDCGNNITNLQQFASLPIPLTLSILPELPLTAAAIEVASSNGKTLMLHQPMEPLSTQNPGPGAIFNDMPPEKAAETLKNNFSQFSDLRFFNNHMGSRVTANRKLMLVILKTAVEHKVQFIDSYTTAGSVTGEVAGELGSLYLFRNAPFLDNNVVEQEILHMLRQGMAVAKEKKYAIMIGHEQNPLLADILRRQHGSIVAAGYRFITVAQMAKEWK